MECVSTPTMVPIFFALTNRLATNGDHVIVLHLYRGIVPVVVRTIATVEPGKAAALLRQCRRHLEILGVESIGHKILRDPRLPAGTPSEVRATETIVSLRSLSDRRELA